MTAAKIRSQQTNEEDRLAISQPAQDTGLDINYLEMSGEVSPLDWAQAVRAATARLHDGWESPETDCHLAMAELEEELAAFLCAYGVIGDEVDRLHAFRTATCTPSFDDIRARSMS
jgi:hypothetical protein